MLRHARNSHEIRTKLLFHATLLVLGLMAAAIPAWAVPPDIARDAIDLIGRADTKGREAPRVMDVYRALMKDAEAPPKAEDQKRE